MTNSKTTKKALFSSVVALLLCFTMLLGTTFAWFTDSASTGVNTIQAGNLDIVVSYATQSDVVDGAIPDSAWTVVDENSPVFDENALWEPGYTEVVYFKIENAGSLALKYIMSANIASETAGTNKDGEEFNLSEYLSAYYMTGDTATVFTTRENAQTVDGWASMMPALAPATLAEAANAEIGSAKALSYEYSLEAGEVAYTTMAVFMPTTIGNEVNHDGTNKPSIKLGINLLATQYTYENDSFDDQYDKDAEYPEIADIWDGTVDTSWYNDTDSEFTLTTAEQLAGLALLAGTTDQFEGKTINLTADVDLAGQSFAPIGTTGTRDDRNRLITEPFKGTFDGNGHTISNISQSGWDFGYEWQQYGSLGLFSQLEGATVKNVVLDGFDCQVEGGDIAFVAGSATGDCVFENIEIKNGTIGTYNNGIGSIIGWSGEGSYTFKDIAIGEDVVLGGLWGSFDSSIGGVVGQGEPGATYNFENVNVACRLDAYNDVTASYQYYLYRMTGMLIGRLEKTTTIDGRNYPDMSQYNITCENVTVTYGDWMNYHYCYGFNGSRYTRVEAGYAYGGLDITAEGHETTCTDHMLCLPFDGLFGGDQYGVRPITEYDGVTVNYPDSYTPEN